MVEQGLNYNLINDLKVLMCWFSPRNYLVTLVAWLAFTGASWAHPMGNFSISHYSKIQVGMQRVDLLYIIDMAEVPTFQEKPEIDLNNNGEVEAAEKGNYLSKKVDTLTRGLNLDINGVDLRLIKVSDQLDMLPGGLNLPTMKITIRYYSDLAPTALKAANSFHFRDNNFPGRVGWKEIVARPAEGIEFIESSVPAADKSQELTVYPEDPTVSPPQDSAAVVTFRVLSHISGLSLGEKAATLEPLSFSKGAGTNSGEPLPSNQSFQQNDPRTLREQQRLTQFLTSSTLGMNVIILAMVVAFGLGAFHALSPGHGKTVVGAYLVGTRGTAKHAVLLGAIVTITHTLGVFVLGLVTLYASKYVLPEKLYPWLGFFSGLAVVVIGFSLFLQRYRALYSHSHDGHSHTHEHHHEHVHPHEHHHDGGHVHDHSHPHSHQHSHHHATEHDHSHHEHVHTHTHHTHTDHAHPHDSHTHEHTHSHVHSPLTHTHGGVTHTHDYSNVRFKDLFTLGVTGGIVPCPSALVVLLSAISLNRVGLGLLLIVAFSFGLALVLMGIGLLMVYARGFMERFSGQGRLWRTLPVFSSLVVTVLGAAIAIQALINGGVVQIRISP
jgi:nickel/cobalt transporter (NicO) family protein